MSAPLGSESTESLVIIEPLTVDLIESGPHYLEPTTLPEPTALLKPTALPADRQWCDVLNPQSETRVRLKDPVQVVVMAGALDLANRKAMVQACTSPEQLHVIVAMSGVTFMDCAGYGALLSAYAALRERGGSLSLLDPAGEPLRLLLLIEKLEHGPSPLLRHTSLSPSLMVAAQT